jgi:hypothetical protein
VPEARGTDERGRRRVFERKLEQPPLKVSDDGVWRQFFTGASTLLTDSVPIAVGLDMNTQGADRVVHLRIALEPTERGMEGGIARRENDPTAKRPGDDVE